MKHLLLSLVMLCVPAVVQAQHVVWFDKPNSLAGKACWWGGHPERYDAQHKPVRAGDSHTNADPSPSAARRTCGTHTPPPRQHMPWRRCRATGGCPEAASKGRPAG